MNFKKYRPLVLSGVVLLLAALIIATLFAESWVTKTPTPQKPISAVPAEPPIGNTNSESVKFSLQNGYLKQASTLNLTAENAEKILYSLNGGEMAEYKSGILLNSGSYNVSAVAVYANGTQSKAVSRSYFVGQSANCTVFSISIDSASLYDSELGIFTNYSLQGLGSERKAFVEIFDESGACVVSQACGVRVFGGESRAQNPKSLRLYARTEYDQENKRFRYEFFKSALDSSGNKLKSANKLSLKTAYSGENYLYAKDELASALALNAGLDAKHFTKALVYLNGQFYFEAWLQEAFSDDWLDHKYNVPNGSWDIVQGTETAIELDTEEPRSAIAKQDFEAMQAYAYKDLTNNAVYAELTELLDVENFITYCAFNAYIGNENMGNLRAYRFVSGDGSFSNAKEKLDGRWRFMLEDADSAFNPNFGLNDVKSDLLSALLKRPELEKMYLSLICDMANSHVEAEKSTALFNSLTAVKSPETEAFLANRAENVLSQLAQIYPNFGQTFAVSVKANENAIITLNSIDITADFGGVYPIGTEILASCTVQKGYKFEHWLVNGEKVYSQSVAISADTELLAVITCESAGIDIYEICYKGQNDYIILKNYSDKPLTTQGMKLTDGVQNPVVLPTSVIRPGATLRIVCKNYAGADAIGAVSCDFSLKEGEMVTLSNKDGLLIRQVSLRDAPQNSALRLNPFLNRYEAVTP